MAIVQIPLTNQPNQNFSISLPSTSANILLYARIYWNRIAEYWQMDISNDRGVALVSGLPLLISGSIYADLLGQFKYLDIGTMFIFPFSEAFENKSPGLNDWGVNHSLIWGP